MMGKAIFDAIKELSNKIDSMDAKFTSRMDKMDARMDAMDEKFTSRIDQLDAKFTRITSNLANDIDAIKKSIEYIKIEQSALRTGLELLDASVQATN